LSAVRRDSDWNLGANSPEATSKSRLGTRSLLALASVAFGVLLGFLRAYSIGLETSPTNFQPLSGYSASSIAAAYATLAVTYPVTVFVFYIIGKRHRSGFITGGNLFAIYGGALLGEILGQTIFAYIPLGSIPFGLPYSFVIAFSGSLSFLFIAFSGFALSNLSNLSVGSINTGRGTLVALLVALAFALEGSLFLGTLSLDSSWLSNIQLESTYTLLSLIVSLPVQLVVFYYIGRKYPISGRTFRYFGRLFVGLYAGGFIGAVVALALFGQSSWVLAPGQGSLSLVDGIIYQNIAPSWQVLLETLNPIRSLPFFSFFAMSLSRTASDAPNTSESRRLEPHL
jgi:hypothetical protein